MSGNSKDEELLQGKRDKVEKFLDEVDEMETRRQKYQTQRNSGYRMYSEPLKFRISEESDRASDAEFNNHRQDEEAVDERSGEDSSSYY